MCSSDLVPVLIALQLRHGGEQHVERASANLHTSVNRVQREEVPEWAVRLGAREGRREGAGVRLVREGLEARLCPPLDSYYLDGSAPTEEEERSTKWHNHLDAESDVLLHETAISWLRDRLHRATASVRKPWDETPAELSTRIIKVVASVNRDCEVANLCRELPPALGRSLSSAGRSSSQRWEELFPALEGALPSAERSSS